MASHGFFTRQGGVSEGIFTSLNCGLGSVDNRENVLENRHRVAQRLGVKPQHLLSLYQVHGADVVTVTQGWEPSALPKADAMVSNVAGFALGILTADCVPVLFEDREAGVVGAAHAGWKGAVAGVVASTVKAMGALGAKPSRIHAAIGPCIGAKSYEVTQEFYDRIVSLQSGNERYFVPGKAAGSWFFDIVAFVKQLLADAGVGEVHALGLDTYVETERFFSFRRTTHAKEPDYGRQISAVVCG